MLLPSDGLKGIKRFVLESILEAGGQGCPPTVVGVGIGGTAELCVKLAKEAIFRPIGTPNSDSEIAALERELLQAINKSGIGPMGLGGDTTALAVHIEAAYTHITMNPVAVNSQCWRGERARARIHPDGNVEYGLMALRLTPVSLAEIMGTWAGRSIRKTYGSSAYVSPHCGPASTT